MKICDFCKSEINDDVKFCPVCGAKQGSKPIAEQPTQPADTAPAEPFVNVTSETMPFGASQAEPMPNQPEAVPFSTPQPEEVPPATAPFNQTQQPVNNGTYFTPNANGGNTEMFNGGAPVQNVAQSKKGKGGKIALVIIGIIVVLVVALIVFGAMSGDDSDVNSSDPSSGTSQSAGSNSTIDKGIADETGYTNASLGLRINSPENWNILAGDDMSEFFEIYPNDNGEYKDSDGTVYEFATLNIDTGSNIIVSSIEGNIADALTSDEEFINDLADDYDDVNEKVSAPFEKTIGSTTYKCIDIDSLSDGEQVKQRMLVVKERKQYFCIVITVFPDYDNVSLDELTDNYLVNN